MAEVVRGLYGVVLWWYDDGVGLIQVSWSEREVGWLDADADP